MDVTVFSFWGASSSPPFVCRLWTLVDAQSEINTGKARHTYSKMFCHLYLTHYPFKLGVSLFGRIMADFMMTSLSYPSQMPRNAYCWRTSFTFLFCFKTLGRHWNCEEVTFSTFMFEIENENAQVNVYRKRIYMFLAHSLFLTLDLFLLYSENKKKIIVSVCLCEHFWVPNHNYLMIKRGDSSAFDSGS